MKRIIHFIKTRKYWVALLVIILTSAGWWYFASNKKAPANVFVVTRGEVVSEVSVTGKVKPAQSLDLAFEKTGRLVNFKVEVGDKVSEAQILANLNNSEFYAQLAQAEASLKAEEAELVELEKGTRPEDIRVKESELQKAEQDLTNYYQDVARIVSDAYNKSDDAVRNKTNDLFGNDDTIPYLTFVTDYNVKIDVESMRSSFNKGLPDWLDEINQISSASPQSDLDKALSNAENNLIEVRNFLNRAMDAVSKSTSLSATTITTYKDNITTGRTNINTALSNVIAQEQDVASQKITVQKIKNELELKLAGSTPEQIAAQEAKVDEAKGNVAYYKAQLNKTILRAPFSGTITKVDYDVGDVISADAAVISLIGRGAYQIEANVAELDIAKIKTGNVARVTLDAYGSDVVFEAKVVKIDLSSTVIEGVATYKTTLQFLKEDPRILAGLTANLDILSDKKENVLYVPTRNIFSVDSRKFVKVLKDEKKNIVEQVEVKTGLKGSDGNTEIISGLQEGDKIQISQSSK